MSTAGMGSYDRRAEDTKERPAAGADQYDVVALARKHGLTQDQARAIIARSGSSREQADEAARYWKRR